MGFSKAAWSKNSYFRGNISALAVSGAFGNLGAGAIGLFMPEYFQQLRIADFFRVKADLHYFGMPRSPCANGFVGGIKVLPSGVAGYNVYHIVIFSLADTILRGISVLFMVRQ